MKLKLNTKEIKKRHWRAAEKKVKKNVLTIYDRILGGKEMAQEKRKKYHTTREQYKNIKKKDRAGMDAFLLDIYTSGYDDGIQQGQKAGLTAADIEKKIAGVKGIGKAKLTAIMEEVEKLF